MENATYCEDELFIEFMQRHGLLNTSLAEQERTAIYWSFRTKLEIDNNLASECEKLGEIDPLWGLLSSMLDHVFQHVEGAIVAYITGSAASCEIICRSVIEASINLLLILIDDRKGERLPQYFAYYLDNKRKETKKWLNSCNNLDSEAQKIHLSTARNKLRDLEKIQEHIDIALSQMKLATTKNLTKKWPGNVFERFKAANLQIEYNTIYASLCSQVHSDAEDLLTYFFAMASENSIVIEKVALRTMNFSRLMLYSAIKYYMIVAGAYAIRFNLKKALKGIELGKDVISKILEDIAEKLELDQ